MKKFVTWCLVVVMIVSMTGVVSAKTVNGNYYDGSYSAYLSNDLGYAWATMSYEAESASDSLPVSLSGTAEDVYGNVSYLYGYGQYGSCSDRISGNYPDVYCQYRVDGTQVCYIVIP